MKKSAFREEQNTYALRQAQASMPAAEVCRKLEITEQRFSPQSGVCWNGCALAIGNDPYTRQSGGNRVSTGDVMCYTW